MRAEAGGQWCLWRSDDPPRFSETEVLLEGCLREPGLSLNRGCE